MERIWANRLWAGTKVWSQVPTMRKAGVEAIMREDVNAGGPMYTAERFTEITGIPY